MTEVGTGMRWAAAAAAALAFLVQSSFVLFASEAYLLRVDDTFYFLEIAERVARDGVFSFDGLHATNGFQPLWQLLLVAEFVVLQALGVDDRMVTLRAVLGSCVLLNVASVLMVLRLFRRTFPSTPRAAAAGALAVLWLPGLSSNLLTGMENSLAWLLLLVLLDALTGEAGALCLPESKTRRATLLLASVLFCATRLDGAVVLAGLASVLLYRRGPRAGAPVLAWGTATLVLLLPLFAWQQWAFGRPLPISGAVKLLGSSELAEELGGPGYLLHTLQIAVLTALALPVSALGMGYYEPVKPLVLYLGFSGVIAALGAAGIVAACAVVWFGRGSGRLPRLDSLPSGVAALGVAALLHLAVTSLLLPKQWRYAGLIWYDLAEYLALFLLFAWLVAPSLQSSGARTWKGVLVAGGAAVVAGSVPMFLWEPHGPTEQMLKVRAVRWMDRNLPEHAVVGSRDAGVTGFFSDRPVVNLDGLVNDERMLEALRSRDVRSYVEAQGISYLVDPLCPPQGIGSFRGVVNVPSEAEILYREEGNEVGLDLCVVRLRRQVGSAGRSR